MWENVFYFNIMTKKCFKTHLSQFLWCILRIKKVLKYRNAWYFDKFGIFRLPNVVRIMSSLFHTWVLTSPSRELVSSNSHLEDPCWPSPPWCRPSIWHWVSTPFSSPRILSVQDPLRISAFAHSTAHTAIKSAIYLQPHSFHTPSCNYFIVGEILFVWKNVISGHANF